MKRVLALLILISSASALAEKMSLEMQNLVVEKLERVLSQIDKKDSSYIPSTLRLADLLAERARTRAMLEVEAGCNDGCKGSGDDRKKALKLYKKALPGSHGEMQGRVLFQIAHLSNLSGDDKKATTVYQDILKNPKKHDGETVSAARVAYADILFQKGQFKEALAESKLALKGSKTTNKGLIVYRMAWSHFNLGHLKEATRTMEKLASSPELLQKENSNEIDASFQGDVLRDLVTFYSRQAVTSKHIASFNSYLPREQRKELLLFFGDEVARLGQKKSAVAIYKLYLDESDLTEDERLRGFMSLTQANFDQGQSGRSTEDFAVAAKAYKESRCSEDAKCEELRKQMKRYVTELHRSKKTQPDMDVLKAYATYAKTFPEDTEMVILGAQVAIDMKHPKIARTLYRHAADKATTDKWREAALAGELDSAERTNNAQLRQESYAHYIQLNANGPKAFEVRYQNARVSYEAKDWKNAGDQFRALALDPKGSNDLRKKSADLALDCLALQKRDGDLEQWAQEFTAALPFVGDEYAKISRKAVLNQTAAVANNSKASNSDLREALAKMQSTSLAKASDDEKRLHLNNQIVLAEKIGDEAALIGSINAMLALPRLSAADRELALKRKVGVYERNLDFRNAYQTALQMRFAGVSTAEKELRLGTLADLGGLNPENHYRAALKAGLTTQAAAPVRARLVLLSSTPLRELESQRKDLARTPAILGETALLVYAKTRNAKDMSKALATPGLHNVSNFIRKQDFFVQHPALANRIARHNLNSQTDSFMQRTIKERVNLLREADKAVSEAVALQDLTAQVMALTTVSVQNRRMVQDLANLPLPKNLTERERDQYVNLLKGQMRPYLVKAKTADLKLLEYWKNDRAITTLIEDARRSRPEVRPMFENELRLLASYATDSGVKSRLEKGLVASTPDQQALNDAREAVRENPNDARQIENLKNLENKMGHPLMGAYLERRLGLLQKGVKL